MFQLSDRDALVFLFLLLAGYLTVIAGAAIKLTDNPFNCFYLLWGFLVLHFSYGVGSLLALVRFDVLFKSLYSQATHFDKRAGSLN